MGTEFQVFLVRHQACNAAKEWAANRTMQQAWYECERGDWLLWLAAKVGVDRKLLVSAACKCARLSLPYVQVGERSALHAIETAEAWVAGEATLEQVNYAASAAYAAYAASAAASAASAAYAAYAAAAAAASAVYAASAASAASAAYAAGAIGTTLLQCTDIVRNVIPYSAIDIVSTVV